MQYHPIIDQLFDARPDDLVRDYDDQDEREPDPDDEDTEDVPRREYVTTTYDDDAGDDDLADINQYSSLEAPPIGTRKNVSALLDELEQGVRFANRNRDPFGEDQPKSEVELLEQGVRVPGHDLDPLGDDGRPMSQAELLEQAIKCFNAEDLEMRFGYEDPESDDQVEKDPLPRVTPIIRKQTFNLHT